jgi:hypothetical protein
MLMTVAAKRQLETPTDNQERARAAHEKWQPPISGKDRLSDVPIILLELVNTCYILHNYFVLSILYLLNKSF